ncbi:hypothetical protein MMC29_000554 [Sticta canariensis]|nr:hypothetical protein [Sticta canariensis]
MIGFRSTYWVSLIKIVSIVDAVLLQSNTFCILADNKRVCPGDSPISVREKFQVKSGYAPWSVGDKTRKPKWEDEFEFKATTESELVVFAPDYCFFTKDVDRVRFAGQHNRYLPATRNTCPNPNSPLTSQSETGGGYLASNDLQLPAGDSTFWNTATDTTVTPGSSPDVFGVQANTQNQFYPATENQDNLVNSVFGFQQANALPPSTSDDGAPNNADTFPDLFSNPGSNYLNLDQLGLAKNTVIGSAGTTTENTSPVAFNLDTLANLPLFRKRDAKRARDFRL